MQTPFFQQRHTFHRFPAWLRRMTSVSTAEASTGYPWAVGSDGSGAAFTVQRTPWMNSTEDWNHETTTAWAAWNCETLLSLRQLQENRFCSTRVLSAFGALFCRPWVKGCYWYAVHPPKLNMWVPIRRATQKSDSSRFRVSGFGFRRLKPTFAVGFGFRVSSIWNPLFAVGFGFRVSGFGFRRLKPTFAVGFGFRVSGFVAWKPTFAVGFGFRVSGLGFRRLKPTFAVGFGFRVWGFVAWNQLSLSVSGFGFRVSSLETNFRCRFRVSGFGFRRLKPTFAVGFGFRDSGFGFRVSLIEANFSCPFRVSGFGFRRSKPPLDSPVRCRSHITQVSFSMQSSKTRAVSDKRLKRSERKNGNGLGELDLDLGRLD